MLQDLYNNFAKCALTIEGFKLGSKENVPYDITELANNYVEAQDNHDEYRMNQYISALMIRYWYMIPLLYDNSKTLRIDKEDIISWLYEAFNKAFTYRSWLDTTKKVSKDPKGAEKCFNQCITSVRQWWFKHLNQDKRKINATVYSLNYVMGSDEYGHEITLLDTVAEEDELKSLNFSLLIQQLLNKDKLFDALILDGIINQDSFIKTNTICEDSTSSSIDFSRRKLGVHLKNLSTEFIDYFVSTYNVPKEKIEQEVMKLGTYKNYKMSKEIEKSLHRLSNNKEVKSLCM